MKAMNREYTLEGTAIKEVVKITIQFPISATNPTGSLLGRLKERGFGEDRLQEAYELLIKYLC